MADEQQLQSRRIHSGKLIIAADNGESIAEIEADGTVFVHRDGKEPDAAHLFWEAVRGARDIIIDFWIRAERRRLATVLSEYADDPATRKDMGVTPESTLRWVADMLRKNRL